MKTKILVAALAAWTMCVGSDAKATIITWNFTATVSENFNSSLNVGNPVSGSFSFNTATAPGFPPGSYLTLYNQSVTAVSIDGFSIVPLWNSQITIGNNYIGSGCHFFCSTSDSFDVFAQFSTPFPSSPSIYQSFNLNLHAASGFLNPGDLSQIVNEDLPTSPYNVNSFQARQIIFRQDSVSGSFRFAANITSLALASAVPEPSTWAMIILGFAGVGFAAYRRGSNSVRWV